MQVRDLRNYKQQLPLIICIYQIQVGYLMLFSFKKCSLSKK